MADEKITGLTPLTSPGRDSLIEVVDDPGGSPVSKNLTLDELWATLMDAREANASADVTHSSTNTPADVTGATLSLPVGTWEINAQFFFYKTATAVTGWRGYICDGSNTILRSGTWITFSNNPSGLTVHVKIPMLVLGTTTTVKLRTDVFAGNSSSAKTLYLNDSLPATWISAKRVA